MLALWRLKLSKTWTTLKFQSRYKRARKTKESEEAIHELASQENFETTILESQINVLLSDSLLAKGKELDLDVPRLRGQVWDDPNWEQDGSSGRPYLSSKGRYALKRLIDDETTRRFEVNMKWVTRFWLPLIVALAGLIGAATGFVLALKK